jgi:hypothetical protein
MRPGCGMHAMAFHTKHAPMAHGLLLLRNKRSKIFELLHAKPLHVGCGTQSRLQTRRLFG